jgi:activator of HSP90 ATPase
MARSVGAVSIWCVVLWLLLFRSPLKSAARGDPQAGTWEEKSHMEWAKGEMERRLVGLSATAVELKVVSIKGCTGDVSSSTSSGSGCCVRH